MDVEVVIEAPAEPGPEVVFPKPVGLAVAAEADVVQVTEQALQAIETATAEAAAVIAETAEQVAEAIEAEIAEETVTLSRAEYDGLIHRIGLAEVTAVPSSAEPTAEELAGSPESEGVADEGHARPPEPRESREREEPRRKEKPDSPPSYGARAWYGGRGR
jgi:hypothetical protein